MMMRTLKSLGGLLTVLSILLCSSLIHAGEKEEQEFRRLLQQLLQQQMSGQNQAAEQTMAEIERLADGPLKDQPALKAEALGYKAAMYGRMGRFKEAEDLFVQTFELGEKHIPPDDHRWAYGLSNWAMLYKVQGRNPDTEPHYQEVLKRYKRLREGASNKAKGPVDFDMQFGSTSIAIGMYAEAETSLLEALKNQDRQSAEIQNAVTDERSLVAVMKRMMTLVQLANLYKEQGRYAEAEPRYLEALGILKNALGRLHGAGDTILTAIALEGLGNLYTVQGRYAEAEPVLKQALRISKPGSASEKYYLSQIYRDLGDLYAAQEKYREAEPLYREAVELRVELYQGQFQDAKALNSLADMYRVQGRYGEAEPLYQRALKTTNPHYYYGEKHPDIARTLNNLAAMYHEQDRDDEAMKLVETAIATQDEAGVSAAYRKDSYSLRAEIHWAKKRRDAALADLREALRLAERDRVQVAGGERERAAAFARHANVFEKMTAWQSELGNAAECLDALERSRARGLLDQMETRGLDLLAGVPENEAHELRRREQEAQIRIASLHKQAELLAQRKDLAEDQRRAEREKLKDQILRAEQDYAKAYAEMRNASPAYRLAVGKDLKPVSLADLQAKLYAEQALLLEYLLGNEGGYLLVVPPEGKPRVETLALDEEQAQSLGVDPGPLTAKRIASVLSNGKKTGVLQILRRDSDLENNAQAMDSLAALGNALIPEAERGAIREGKYRRLMILPDAALASLPFEALVVQAGEKPQYLLDVCPPIEYAPSATILMNLAERREQNDVKDREPVLTVGDCRYGQPAGLNGGNLLALQAPRARYGVLGGRLESLPFSATEILWVSKVFGDVNTKVAWLKGDLATEAAVRFNAPGRRLLHFACHGLVDERYGNLFGALALTPGPNAVNPADDGLLTLAEIYEMNLKGCELAILSACDTNVGPQQRGEGIWALSRGFLVAGARRVVASNWLVDDEAAPNFVSYFTSILAKAEKEGKTPDYAQALHNAKRWMRNHKNKSWRTPYYWGTFVLIGPG